MKGTIIKTITPFIGCHLILGYNLCLSPQFRLLNLPKACCTKAASIIATRQIQRHFVLSYIRSENFAKKYLRLGCMVLNPCLFLDGKNLENNWQHLYTESWWQYRWPRVDSQEIWCTFIGTLKWAGDPKSEGCYKHISFPNPFDSLLRAFIELLQVKLIFLNHNTSLHLCIIFLNTHTLAKFGIEYLITKHC